MPSPPMSRTKRALRTTSRPFQLVMPNISGTRLPTASRVASNSVCVSSHSRFETSPKLPVVEMALAPSLMIRSTAAVSLSTSTVSVAVRDSAPSLAKAGIMAFSPCRSSGVYMASSLHFFAIDVQRLHGGPVGHREQDALAAGGVLVLVPVPGRHDEEVALLPLEALPFDLGDPIAAEGLIDRGAGMAVRLQAAARTQQLDVAGKRWQ